MVNGYNQDKQSNRREGTRRPAGGRFSPHRRKSCFMCSEGLQEMDYKDVVTLQRFITERGKIRPRRQTGLCAKHQRRIAAAIKRARIVALLPYVAEPTPER